MKIYVCFRDYEEEGCSPPLDICCSEEAAEAWKADKNDVYQEYRTYYTFDME